MGKSTRIRRGINILPGPVINFTTGLQGTYILFIRIKAEISIEIKKRDVKLLPGYYIYIGSAFGAGGLSSRLHRHMRKTKKKHWHIDQVTMSKNTQIEGIGVSLEKKNECQIASIFSSFKNIIPINGVGNSDCSLCQSHFFLLDRLKTQEAHQ